MKLALKVLMVAAMTLAILVPLSMIRGVIHERQGYRQQAVADVAANYGGRQVFGGPVLVVPYTETVEEQVPEDSGGLRRIVRRNSGTWTFFPETLVVEGALQPDVRKRGLHEVRVYQWNGSAQARLDVRLPADEPGKARREIGQPWLSYGIADVRGLDGAPKLSLDGRVVELSQGIGHDDGPGLHVRLEAPAAGARIALQTRIELRLRGTEAFALMPYGRSNDLRLHSPWRHPKFDGVSPQQDIDASGFRAHWRISSMATNAQRRYLQQPSLARPEPSARGPWMPDPDSVSVSLVDPVNPYLQADRATKYGLLFVLLTFVGFFMFELVKRLRIHPIQYALVGLALAIFFLLLVALSEHIAFGRAYLAASVACIGLLGFYLSAVLRSRVRGFGFAVMLAMLYAALYGLLVSEDNALVMGAGLLFAILAALMVVTRKVDWYQVSAGDVMRH